MFIPVRMRLKNVLPVAMHRAISNCSRKIIEFPGGFHLDSPKIISKLNQIAWFSGLKTSSLQALAYIAMHKRFDKGEIIFSEGETAHGFYIILSGSIKIYKLAASGKEQILHFFSTGEPFGEVPVFQNSKYPAFSEAVTRSDTLYFPALQFRQIIAQNPEVAMEMLAILSKRLHEFTIIIDDLSLKEVPARLARYLLHLSKNQNSEILTLDISKTQLAAVLGTIPETLSRTLAKISRAGIIKTDGAGVIIENRDLLEELSWTGKLE